MKRRRFLGHLAATAGAPILVACGGEVSMSGSDGANASPSAAAKAGAAAGVSPNGTMVTDSTGSIVDNSGAVWTLNGNIVYRNGTAAMTAWSVSMILWYGGSIYVQKVAAKWMQRWDGAQWSFSADPRLGGTASDNTIIRSGGAMLDNWNTQWTLTNGTPYRNGQARPLPSAASAALLLWYGSLVYAQDASGQFFVNTPHAQWKTCSDPRLVATARRGIFYGMNGHPDYPAAWTPQKLVAALQALSCTVYRVNVSDQEGWLGPVALMAQQCQANGITLFACLDLGLRDVSTNTLYASESAAYTACFARAKTVATRLAPYGVKLFECGNELTRDQAIILHIGDAGTKPADFNTAHWPILRGAIRGMMAGVKAVIADAQCAVNFCVADVAAADMLWEGSQPDGSSTPNVVRWDITSWHNYQSGGDLFAIGIDTAGPTFNLPVYAKARYGRPFYVTEWNDGDDNHDSTSSLRANYVTKTLQSFYANRDTCHIDSVMYYALSGKDADTNFAWSIVDTNLQPIQPTYGAFTAFASGHPDR